jgi:predicted ester cyclase
MSGPEQAVATMVQAVNAHDLDGVAALAPENERFRESHRRMLAAFPDVHLELQWTVTEGDKCVAWCRIQGTHRGEWRGIAPTGRPIDVLGMMALRVDQDGMVTDFWLVNDWLTIATQIGATLQPPT